MTHRVVSDLCRPVAAGSYSATMPEPTHSAVLVIVPPAEAIVGDLRRRFVESATWGVPAHVTVLYPFVTPRTIDDRTLTRLGKAVAAVPRLPR